MIVSPVRPIHLRVRNAEEFVSQISALLTKSMDFSFQIERTFASRSASKISPDLRKRCEKADRDLTALIKFFRENASTLNYSQGWQRVCDLPTEKLQPCPALLKELRAVTHKHPS